MEREIQPSILNYFWEKSEFKKRNVLNTRNIKKNADNTPKKINRTIFRIL